MNDFFVKPRGDSKNYELLLILSIAAIAIIIRVVHFHYTERTWEDALVAVLHAENFWNGLGLTHFHNNQSPTYGFTSPIIVLIALIGEAFNERFGLIFIKIVSIFSGGMTVLYAYSIGKHPKINLPFPLLILITVYFTVEYQQILWGMAGMETQIVALILLMSVKYLLDGNHKLVGVTLGLSMLARPDMLFWCVIVGFYYLVNDRKEFIKILAISLLVYSPWVIFTTLYYGSFIPNTIEAKFVGFPAFPLPHSFQDFFV